jgi:signal peptidase II
MIGPDAMHPRMTLPRFGAWLLLAGLIVALDLWTKHLASANLDLYRPVAITDWMNLTLAHNTGAAFSLLADQDGWQRWFFVIFASGISLFLVIWLWRLPLSARLLPAALMLVLGGAIGNLADRIRLGYVVDFIDLHYNNWHWPAFNIADSAIVIGVTLMLIESLLPPRPPPKSLNKTL